MTIKRRLTSLCVVLDGIAVPLSVHYFSVLMCVIIGMNPKEPLRPSCLTPTEGFLAHCFVSIKQTEAASLFLREHLELSRGQQRMANYPAAFMGDAALDAKFVGAPYPSWPTFPCRRNVCVVRYFVLEHAADTCNNGPRTSCPLSPNLAETVTSEILV